MKYITLYQTLQLSQPPCKCRVKQSLKFEAQSQNHEPIVCAIYLSLVARLSMSDSLVLDNARKNKRNSIKKCHSQEFI